MEWLDDLAPPPKLPSPIYQKLTVDSYVHFINYVVAYFWLSEHEKAINFHIEKSDWCVKSRRGWTNQVRAKDPVLPGGQVS